MLTKITINSFNFHQLMHKIGNSSLEFEGLFIWNKEKWDRNQGTANWTEKRVFCCCYGSFTKSLWGQYPFWIAHKYITYLCKSQKWTNLNVYCSGYSYIIYVFACDTFVLYYNLNIFYVASNEVYTLIIIIILLNKSVFGQNTFTKCYTSKCKYMHIVCV